MDVEALHEAAAGWYASNARDLPWRSPPFLGDPYAILVSEVMLQQTQVDRTIPKFLEFMDRFPTLMALAEAPAAEAIRFWSGMGYNGRAVRLHRLARIVTAELDGDLPADSEALRKLPGIGPYTAAAVACFAFGANEPVLDTNVYRVLSRLVHGTQAPSRKELEPLAREMLPDGSTIDAPTWHQALMDIGATLCTVARPRCMLCPLRAYCAAAPALQDGSSRSLAEASVPYAPKQGRFAGSNRYYRGRVVEALRALTVGTGLPLTELGPLLAETYDDQRDGAWLDVLVAGLVRDGLVWHDGGWLTLP